MMEHLGHSLADQGFDYAVKLADSPAALREAWPTVTSLLNANPDTWQEYYSTENLFVEVLSTRMQLWLAYDDEGTFACAFSELRNYPRCKVFRFLIGVGDPNDTLRVVCFLKSVMLWAKNHGAHKFEIFGRPGWQRALKAEGYDFEMEGTTISYDLNQLKEV